MKKIFSTMQKGIEKANKMKKAALIAAIAFLVSTQVSAQGGTTGPLTWNLEDGVLTISGIGKMEDYGYHGSPWYPYSSSFETIIIEPGVTSIGMDSFSGCSSFTSITIPNSVTDIGMDSFSGCSSLTSITIPYGVTRITMRTFDGCSSLTSITIPNSVTSIEQEAFSSCSSLASITIPNSVTYIGFETFYRCSSLASITIPNSVTSIGAGAFYGCSSLTSITIPNSVTSIEYRIFAYCSSLTSIHVAENNSAYSSKDGVLFNKNKTILVAYPAGREGEYIIPNSVTKIADFAFSACSGLTSVTIPISVASIESYAFYECISLKEITNINPEPQVIEYNVISGIDQAACKLVVQNAAVTAYKAARIWEDFNIVSGSFYTVNAPANNTIAGNVDGGGLYRANTRVTLTAVANSGYEFENWTINGAVVSTQNPYSFTVTKNIEITANFKGYTVAAYPNNIDYGSVSGGGFYVANATARLTAAANSGFEFENWTVDGAVVSTKNPYSFTVTADIEIIANFKSDGTSIDEAKKEFDAISIYPNPTTSQITVSAQECAIKQLALFNQAGQQIAQTTASEINLESFPAGLYILQIKTDKGIATKKVVKR